MGNKTSDQKNSFPVSSHKERIIFQLLQRYHNLKYQQLIQYYELLPNPIDYSHIDASFQIDLTEEPQVRRRLHRYFEPLSPITYLEKTIHLVHGSPKDRCRLLFHLFCHKCYQLADQDVKDDQGFPQFYMDFHEFQAAIELLVKGKIEWKNNGDKYIWLFQIADEYKENRVELSQFAKVVTEHPLLSNYLKQMCLPLWKRELHKVKEGARKDLFENAILAEPTEPLSLNSKKPSRLSIRLMYSKSIFFRKFAGSAAERRARQEARIGHVNVKGKKVRILKGKAQNRARSVSYASRGNAKVKTPTKNLVGNTYTSLLSRLRVSRRQSLVNNPNVRFSIQNELSSDTETETRDEIFHVEDRRQSMPALGTRTGSYAMENMSKENRLELEIARRSMDENLVTSILPSNEQEVERKIQDDEKDDHICNETTSTSTSTSNQNAMRYRTNILPSTEQSTSINTDRTKDVEKLSRRRTWIPFVRKVTKNQSSRYSLECTTSEKSFDISSRTIENDSNLTPPGSYANNSVEKDVSRGNSNDSSPCHVTKMTNISSPTNLSPKNATSPTISMIPEERAGITHSRSSQSMNSKASSPNSSSYDGSLDTNSIDSSSYFRSIYANPIYDQSIHPSIVYKPHPDLIIPLEVDTKNQTIETKMIQQHGITEKKVKKRRYRKVIRDSLTHQEIPLKTIKKNMKTPPEFHL